MTDTTGLLLLLALISFVELEATTEDTWKIYGRIYGYEYKRGKCLWGKLKTIQNVNFHGCQEYCGSTSYCSGFNYEDYDGTHPSNCSATIGRCRLDEYAEGQQYFSRRSNVNVPREELFSLWAAEFGYSYYPRKGCKGGEQDHPSTSLDDCRNACVSYSNCSGFTWKSYIACTLHTQDCVMTDYAPYYVHLFEQDWGWELNNTGCAVDDPGNGIVEENKTLTKRQCHSKCAALDWCTGFEYTKDGECRLKIDRCSAWAEINSDEATEGEVYFTKPREVNDTSTKDEGESRRLQSWAYSRDYVYGAGFCQQNGTSEAIATKSTLEKCRQLCDASYSCSVFIYDLAGNRCWLKGSICASETAPLEKGLRVFAKAGKLAEEFSRGSNYTLPYGDCPGPNVRSLNRPKTECLKACSNASWCSAVTFNLSSGECFLKLADCSIETGRPRRVEIFSLVKPVGATNLVTESSRMSAWAHESDFTYSGEISCSKEMLWEDTAREQPPAPRDVRLNETAIILAKCAEWCRFDYLCSGFSWYRNNSCYLHHYRCVENSDQNNKRHVFIKVPTEKVKAKSLGYTHVWGRCMYAERLLYIRYLLTADWTRGCWRICQRNPACTAFMTTPGLSCVLVIGDCKEYSERNKMVHTLLRPSNTTLQRVTRFYLLGKQMGFRHSRGSCTETKSMKVKIEQPIGLKDCIRSCEENSTCVSIDYAQSPIGETGLCRHFNHSCTKNGDSKGSHVYDRGEVLRDFKYQEPKQECPWRFHPFGNCLPDVSVEECAESCKQEPECDMFMVHGEFLRRSSCCRRYKNISKTNWRTCSDSDKYPCYLRRGRNL